MPSSERKAYLRFKSARYGSGAAFHAFARDLVGNVDHLADQFAQDRIRWVAQSASHYFEPEDTVVADTFQRVWVSGPFDLHVRDTGESYALRIRIRGAISTGSAVCTWRVAVASETHGRAYVSDPTNNNVVSATTSSATHSWLDVSPAVIALSTDQIFQAARSVNTADEAGGASVEGRWLRCTAEVWASTTVAASVPRLSGLQLSEYYAP